MLGVSINIFGPHGEIWIFGLVRRPPWSTHHSKRAKTLNITMSSPLVEFCISAIHLSTAAVTPAALANLATVFIVSVSLFFAIAAIDPCSVLESTLYITTSAVYRIIFRVGDFFIALVHCVIAAAAASFMPCRTSHDAQATGEEHGK